MVETVLSPNDLGPTVCVGEILVEIVATSVGNGFLEAQPLVGPYPSGAPAILLASAAGSAAPPRWWVRWAKMISAVSISTA